MRIQVEALIGAAPVGAARSWSGMRTRRSPAGGDVIVQKYLHDLDAWDGLPVEEQERAIGRTKLTTSSWRTT